MLLFEESRKLIQLACTPWGIKASLTELDNYGAIFTRDAVMAGIAGILINDEIIIEGLKNSLYNLKEIQGNEGQIASNFKVKNNKIDSISFGTMSPKIDSCTWYLIGVGLMIKKGFIKKEDYQESIDKTIRLLDALEFNGKHLIYVPKGGNWADEYVYEGYVLYDQLLRVWGLSLMANIFENSDWNIKSLKIKESLQLKYNDKKIKYLLSSIYPGGTFDKFDLAANALFGIIMSEDNFKFKEITHWISKQFLNKKILPPVFHPVIKEGDPDWKTLRQYHLFDFKNKPHHYHNGGIWWIWLGWFAISLSKQKMHKELDILLDTAFKQLEALPNFTFDEYLSASELLPNGTKNLCYTATGIIFMHLAKKSIDLSSLIPTHSDMIKENLIINDEYFKVSAGLVNKLEKLDILAKNKLVIGVCGESGSGKSTTAKCLQIELNRKNIRSVILHQDSYYKLTPKENNDKRKSDLNWVGPNEVNLDLMQFNIDQFLNNSEIITTPIVDYENNKFSSQETSLKNIPVLIVEGVYTFMLDNIDFKVFMERTYLETIAKRKLRNRELYDPFIEDVLEIEHNIIKKLKDQANIIISREYQVYDNI